jgi:hypothetical protein
MMNMPPMDERALIHALGMGGGMPQMPMDDATILQALGYMAGPQSVPSQVMGMPQMQPPMAGGMPMPMMEQMPSDNYGSDARMRMMQQVNPDGQPLQTQPMLAEFLRKYGNKVGR